MCINKLVVVSTISSVFHPFAANAAVLADWDFSGIPAEPASSENTPLPNPVLGAAAANAAAGLASSDLDHSGLLYSTAVSPGAVGTSVPGELNTKNFDLGGNGTNDNFLFFQLLGSGGNTFNVVSISINLWRNGGGAPDGIAFDVSVDSGPFELYDSVKTQGLGAGVFVLQEFNESIVGASRVEIRFTPRNTTSGSTGNFHINGLTVEGSVVTVPEPSGPLFGIIGLGLFVLRRKR